MSKGVLLIANNNSDIDYILQACYSAKRIKRHLKLPVSLVTDTPELFKTTYKKYRRRFDKVILCNSSNSLSSRSYKDGVMFSKVLEFKNASRALSYDLTPYDETLVLDTDVIIFNDVFLKCFDQLADIMMYRNSVDVSPFRSTAEFERISDVGVDFFWATCVYFRKSEKARIFFNLTKHITENWNHYRLIYNISSPLYRNDFVFSIAAHTLNGFNSGIFVKEMPGVLIYSTDRDEIVKIDDTQVVILVQKASDSEIGVLAKIKDTNVHIMNKYNLDRIIKNDS